MRPSVLLPLLILLGLIGMGVTLWLPQSDKKTAPSEQAQPNAPSTIAPLEDNPLLPQLDRPKESGEESQISILQAQVQYLEDQVRALREENSLLVDQLAKLGIKQGGPMAAVKVDAPPSDVPVDYVSLGGELLAARELEDIPMPTVQAPQGEVQQVIHAWLKRQLGEGYGQREGAAFSALGAIPKPIDTLSLRSALLVRLMGGWYDEESSTLYLVDPKSPVEGQMPQSDPILALAFGNLLHHYQKSLLPAGVSPLTTDERLARLSLIAGDAALQRFLHDLKQFKGPDPSKIPADDPDHPLNQVPMPAYLRELEVFPLAQGLFFTQALHSLGGFKQVGTAYGRPPETTAEVLDTERYLAEQRLALPRIHWTTTKIGEAEPFWDDRLGQYATLAFLKRYNAQETAGEAAKGWITDRFLAYSIDGDLNRRGHAVWQTYWSNPERADKFLKALKECLAQFYDASFDGSSLSAQGRTIHVNVLADKHSILFIDAASPQFERDARETLK